MSHLFSGSRKHRAILCLVVVGVCLAGKSRLEKTISSPTRHLPAVGRAQANLELDSVKRFNLGFTNLLSGLLWVQLLQKSDTSPIRIEEVSWEFTKLNAITSMDPNFDISFSYGSVFLSVFKRDRLGARIILEKWVKQRPTYWRAQYLLGYHLYYELGLFKEGSEHLLKAASLEHSPGWLTALGIRLLSATGALAQSLKVACELYPALHSMEGQYRLRKRVRSLNYALQKAGWTEALTAFRKKFKKEPSNIAELRPELISQVRGLSSLLNGEEAPELQPILREGFHFAYDAKTRSIRSTQNLTDLDVDITGIHVPEGENHDS